MEISMGLNIEIDENFKKKTFSESRNAKSRNASSHNSDSELKMFAFGFIGTIAAAIAWTVFFIFIEIAPYIKYIDVRY